MLPIRKNATLLLTAVCGFSSYTVKNLNLLYTSLKTLQLLDFCSQSEKNLHIQAPACTCSFLPTAKNPVNYSQNKFPKTAATLITVSIRKKTLSGSCPYVSFSPLHC